MKPLLLALAMLFTASAACAQGPQVYQCVRPDGTVVCNVSDTSGEPSVSCNRECKDCNMVCEARLRLTEEGGVLYPVQPAPPAAQYRPAPAPAPGYDSGYPATPPPTMGDDKRSSAPAGTVETREYCRKTYQDCTAKCRSTKNVSSYDQEACLSSCESWYSGCGTWRPGMGN